MPARRIWEGARSVEEMQDLLLEEQGLFFERRPSLDTPLAQSPLAFFDVETTGLDPEHGDRVVEIAILRVDPGGTERRFVEIFNPGREIPEPVRRIHALRPAQVRASRKFAAASGEIADLLSDAVWVGHNLSFDVRFLRWEMMRCGRPLPPGWILDTWLIARRWCDLPRNSLAAVAEHLGHGGRNLHQALDDILTARAVLPSLLARVTPPPRSLRDALAAMVPSREEIP